jgi:hypothetical protein
MEKRIKERAKQALKELEISVASVAKFRGLSDRTLLDQINGSSKIGAATLEALLAYRPDLSAEWLLRGTGEMLVSSIVPTEGQPREHRENTDQIVDANKKVLEQIQELAAAQKEAYAAAINEKDDKIQELKYYVDLQKDYIDGQKKTIEKLEQFIEHLKEENRELKKARTSATELHAKSV